MRCSPSEGMVRVGRILALSLALAAGCTRNGSQGGTPLMSPARCAITETSRTPLVVDGNREMYIEPTVVLPSGNRILLAGRPNYLFSPHRSPASPGITQDSVFGAVLDAQGRASLVPAPIDPALVAHTRAIAMDGGGWAMVFGELNRPWEPPRPDTTVRLWYGEFDGTAWGTLEPLPHIPNGVVNPQLGSELLRHGDTLLLAMPIGFDSLKSQGIALFERVGGRWTAEHIDVRAAYTQLIHSDSLGLLIAVVQPDRAFRQDLNSLILYGRRPRWSKLRSLVRGGSYPVHDPRVTMSARGVVLSWSIDDLTVTPVARRVRTMAITETGGGVIELDSDIDHFTPVTGFARFPLWITQHRTVAGTREIRYLADSIGGAAVLGTSVNPFTGPMAATATGASDILVSGPLFQADSARPRLVSLLIRARVECRRSAP